MRRPLPNATVSALPAGQHTGNVSSTSTIRFPRRARARQ